MAGLRVGIIGLGVGEQHLAAFNAHDGCEVVTACDLSQAKLDEVAASYPNVRMTMDASDILDDPSLNVVSVASYDDHHHTQVVRALRNGKHVFVEKPMCLFPEEAWDIRAHLRERPELKLSSNLALRTCPRFIRVREAARSGEMGQLYCLEGDYLWGRKHKLTHGWRTDMPFYSITYGAGVHMVDLILWITGQRPVEVQAYGNQIATQNSALRYNDFALLLLRFESGMVAKVSCHGGCIHPHFHKLAVYGTKKTFTNDFTGAQWLEASDPETPPVPENTPYPAREERAKVVASFADSLLDTTIQPDVPGDEVFDTMSVCFAAEQAIREGVPVSISYI